MAFLDTLLLKPVSTFGMDGAIEEDRLVPFSGDAIGASSRSYIFSLSFLAIVYLLLVLW
jgi:hypothetical protein